MRILIAGCGDVGGKLGELLVEAGHLVWGLRRNTARLPQALHPIAADFGDPRQLTDLPEVDVLYYTAAASSRTEEGYRLAYITGLQNVLTALAHQKKPLRHAFFTSSTSVYHQDGGQWVDEASETHPQSFTGQLVLRGEKLLAEAPIPSTAVRFSGIYGPGRTYLIERVRSGYQPPPEPPFYTNRIHRDDCARVLAHLLTMDQPASLYLASDSQPTPMHEVATWLRSQMKKAGLQPAPATGASPPTRNHKRCRNKRLLATGYQFTYPTYREGYTPLITERQCVAGS